MNDLRERYDFLFDGSGDLTQETLLLYVFGPLENEARQAVEQHLETCEMCRDAAEGIALLGTKEQALSILALTDAKLTERVAALKQKVTRDGKEALINQSAEAEQAKTQKPQRRIGWYRYAAAASVIVVVGIAFWLFNQNMQHDYEGISMKQEDSLDLFKDDERKNKSSEPEVVSMDSSFGFTATSPNGNVGNGTTAPKSEDGTGNYNYEWDSKKDNAATDEDISLKRNKSASTSSISVTDANSSTKEQPTYSNAPAAQKPSPPAPDKYKELDNTADIASFDLETEEVDALTLGEMTLNDDAAKFKSDDKISVVNDTITLTTAGASNGFVTSNKSAAPITIDKGTSNSNFTLNNAANMTLTDASVNQAQYPGGMAAVQKYFDKATYPVGTKKGYKGVIVLELSFDEKGKITKSSIIQGLGNPYDVVILDHLKKMPSWEAPQPYGEPFASTRVVTVEVTVR